MLKLVLKLALVMLLLCYLFRLMINRIRFKVFEVVARQKQLVQAA